MFIYNFFNRINSGYDKYDNGTLPDCRLFVIFASQYRIHPLFLVLDHDKFFVSIHDFVYTCLVFILTN